MNEYLILKLLHILLFVYWLGGDLGTFYASKFVARSDLSEAQRSTALTIMMGVDQGPRICMALILGPGVHMAISAGMMELPSYVIPLTWLMCFGWLAMVLAIHFGHGKSYLPKLTQFDFYFRVVVIAVCAYVGISSLMGGGVILQDWLAIKLLVFGALVACGLGIRVYLKPFIPAFGAMMQHGKTEEGDRIMQNSLSRVRPFVYLIWVGLLVNTALGMHLI